MNANLYCSGFHCSKQPRALDNKRLLIFFIFN